MTKAVVHYLVFKDHVPELSPSWHEVILLSKQKLTSYLCANINNCSPNPLTHVRNIIVSLQNEEKNEKVQKNENEPVFLYCNIISPTANICFLTSFMKSIRDDDCRTFCDSSDALYKRRAS